MLQLIIAVATESMKMVRRKEQFASFQRDTGLKKTPRGELSPLNAVRLNAMSAFVVFFESSLISYEWVAVRSLTAFQVKRSRGSIGYIGYILSVILFTRIQSTVYIAVWSLLVIVQTRKYYLHTRKKKNGQ